MRRLAVFLVAVFLLSLLLGARAGRGEEQRVSEAPGCMTPTFLPIMMNNRDASRPVTAASAPARPVHANDQPDFNGDGCADLAVGVRNKSVDGHEGAGAVNVIYGGADGLTNIGNQMWHRNGGFDATGEYLGDLQAYVTADADFGAALSAGDFNNDGYSDLAIGVTEEEGATPGGAVHVLYGSPDGLLAAGNQLWTQNGGYVDPDGDGTGEFIGDLYGGSEPGDRFGYALTSGYFNDDDYADLAVGVPYESIGAVGAAGAVNVIYGSPDGLSHLYNQTLHQDNVVQHDPNSGGYNDLGDLIGGVELNDRFGNALAAGDVDGDGDDDLIIGVFYEDIGSVSNAGAMHIVRGSISGLVTQGNQHWHQQAAYVDFNGDGTVDETLGDPTGLAEPGDSFGYSLAVGYFNDDAYADVAVSSPSETLSVDGTTVEYTGVVHVFFGTATGPSMALEQYVEQDSLRTNGALTGNLLGNEIEADDWFGLSLTAGDFNRDGLDELVIGIPFEDVLSDVDNFGAALVLYGTAGGLGVADHTLLSRPVVLREGVDQGHLVGNQGFSDSLGWALGAADYNNDGYDDLVAGVPSAISMQSAEEAGGLNLLLGSAAGLTLAGNQAWEQGGGWNDLGEYLGDLVGVPATSDLFGYAFP